MPIMPTLTPRWNRRAASPLDVKIAVPLPYGFALISAIASSTESAADDREHRAEDLLAVDVHLGVTFVDERRADEEAVLVPVDHESAAVDGEPRRLDPHPSRSARRSARLAAAVTTGPISLCRVRPGPDVDRPRLLRSRRSTSASAASPTATATEIAMQRSPAEPNAGGDQVVGGEVEVGVGQHDRVVLRAAERLHALAVRGRRARGRTCAIGVEPTNETAAMSGWSSIASTATLSPWTTLNTPSGSPASAYSSATRVDADGSRSDGLSTNVLPHAIAIGCIHIGTMTGKLNGVMPAHDAERLTERVHVDVRSRPGRSTRP